MFIDSWGRESNTREEAEKKIRKTFNDGSREYYITISEQLNIPTEYFLWIVNNYWEKFKEDFADDIKLVEDDWCSYYFDELIDTEEEDV